MLFSHKRFTLPIHLPIYSKYKKDFNNLKTVTVKGRNVPVPSVPAGVVYVGNMQSTNEQVWWDKPLCCTHLFFLATTGGGKTFSFAGILANFIVYSGFFYSDAKADLALVETYSRFMWRMGRINQLYILSFQSGNRSPWSIRKDERISHTFNPAASASAPMIAELFKSLLDGDGDIWAKRGDNLSTVLIRPLTYQRDFYGWPMGFGQIANFFSLEKLGELCGIGEGRNDIYAIPEINRKYFKPLNSFIRTLPGLTENDYEGLVTSNKELISKITPTTRDQLGFVTMQLVNVTNDLVGDYGHIFETMYGQINTEDALTNRKVVITLLPALERSESTMSVLGRISLASQKTVVANAQAFKLEGELSDHIGSRPTAADVPYASVNDEAGSYMVDGVSANTAMARSANVSFWFGGQDLPAMKKRGGMIEKEVDTIWGTTVNKMAGSVLEENTINAFISAADEEYRLEATDFEVQDNGYFKKRISNRLSVQSRKLLTPKMLSNQEPGQVQLLTRGTVRALSLPNFMTKGLSKPIKNFYVTETVPVIPLPYEKLHIRNQIRSRMENAINVFEKGNVFELKIDELPDFRSKDNGVNRTVTFFSKVMGRFKHKEYEKLSLFTAQCLLQFYIDEHCADSLKHIKFSPPKVDETQLLPHHEAAIPKLFVKFDIYLHDAETGSTSAILDDANLSKEDEDEDEDEVGSDEFYANARAEALKPENIDAFQQELAKELNGEYDDRENISDVVYSADDSEIVESKVSRVVDSGDSPNENESSTSASYLSDFDNGLELNLSLGSAEMIDIANILSSQGVMTSEPTLISEQTLTSAEEAKSVVDDDLASLDAIRTYRPKEYKPSKEVIVNAISSLINSLNEEME